MRKVLLGLLVLASGGLAGWLIVLDRQNRLLWDHWDVVKPGILYRSGQLTADQLTEAVRLKGIRTVVSFQLPGKEMNSRASAGAGTGNRLREPADARRRLWRGGPVPQGPGAR